MRFLLEILVYGGVQSAVYALLATGFCLILGVARVVNLAHTGFYMISAYMIYTFFSLLNLNLYISLVLSVVITGFLAVLVMQFFVRPLIKSETSVLVITIALVMFFQEAILSTFGPVDRNLPNFIEDTYKLFGMVDVDAQRLLILIVAPLLIIGLLLFINHTKLGRAIQAVAQDSEGATLMGVNPDRIYLQVIFISAVLAAVAGAFIAPTLGARPHMWDHPLGRVFAVVVLGGMGSVEGTIFAALIIGFIEVVVSFTLSSYLGDLVALAVLLLVLFVRPTGLMGKRVEA